MIRPSVLLFALLMSAPAWYRLVLDEVDVLQVLIRFLIAVPIAAVLLAGLRFIIGGYRTTTDVASATTMRPEPFDARDPDKPV
ncbi:hypothetical protein [Actinoplanes sp. GCM10030250]|uniref:hypothetical protein n=1 Tax=Actinoplanes sp. GCM10030250 TaxID=3273376 RepID=UPI003612225C